MAPNKILEQWREGNNRSADKPQEDPLDPPGDTFEEPSGDGRTSRHQVFGIQIEDSNRDLWFIPYATILPSKLGPVNGGKYTFKIAGDTENYELEIEGPVSAVRYALDKLCSGKRELLRSNDHTITAIRVKVVPVKK
ncbi:hypothetical protein [Fimbriiglobus ruber]|uniref:Uncharacterized protein n=1 Tax=Fimbriiglobus ruber TaxID=1908690 RepID=A0A225DD61_9BACT|nr:hypothetical protein [Fimbriiglobus ruber]OWK39500.1 hypothetical protein FRUB_06063 [Fimbriiglobus ruber]